MAATHLPTAPPVTDALPTSRTIHWIVGPAFDGFFFFASVVAVIAAYVATHHFHVNGFLVLSVVAVISNGPHLASTWTRVYFDAREWRMRPVAIFAVPAAIACFVAVTSGFYGREGARLLNSILLYWATWHFLAQNWGILRVYQRKSAEPAGSLAMKLERPLLNLIVAWCLTHRMQTGPRVLFGTEALHLRLPWEFIDLLGAAAITLAAALVVLRLRETDAPWAPDALVRMGFLFAAFLGFYVPFILITEEGTAAFAAAACWHGFQYLGIVRHYHLNAWKQGSHPDARLMSWIAQPGKARTFAYVALLMSLAGVGFLFIWTGAFLTRGTSWDMNRWGGVVWLSFTFSHYWLDGVIWKLRRDTLMAQRLGLQVDAPAA